MIRGTRSAKRKKSEAEKLSGENGDVTIRMIDERGKVTGSLESMVDRLEKRLDKLQGELDEAKQTALKTQKENILLEGRVADLERALVWAKDENRAQQQRHEAMCLELDDENGKLKAKLAECEKNSQVWRELAASKGKTA